MIRAKANLNEITDEQGDIDTDPATSDHVPACL